MQTVSNMGRGGKYGPMNPPSTPPTIDTLKREVIDAGFRVSAGSWEDDRSICVMSVETWGPNTYGHPQFTAFYAKDTGYLTVGGKSCKIGGVA